MSEGMKYYVEVQNMIVGSTFPKKGQDRSREIIAVSICPDPSRIGLLVVAMAFKTEKD